MSLENELAVARQRHDANVLAIENQHRELVQNAEDNHDAAELAYNATRISVGQRDATYARAWFYVPFLVGLSAIEVPVNQMAFQLYFGEGTFASTVITFGIGAALVSFAHTLGVTLRRFRHNARMPGGIAASLGWTAALILTSIVISYSLAILRQAYLEFRREPDPTLTELINQGREFEAAAAVVGSGFLHFALAIDGWIFFCINIAILVAGVLASFWSHDPHPDYARQHQKLQRAWKVLQRRKQDAGRDLATEQANLAARLDQICRRYPEMAPLKALPPY